MPYNILSCADKAIAAYIAANNPSFSKVYPAKNAADKELPCIICYAQSGQIMEPAHSNIYQVDMAIMVKTSCDVDINVQPEAVKEDSEATVRHVFDLFHVSVNSGHALADDITQTAQASGDFDLGDFVIQSVEVKNQDAGFDPKTDAWIDTLNLELICSVGRQ
jgi:hypothetical protein